MSSLYPENNILVVNQETAAGSGTGYGKSPVFLFDRGEFKMVDGRVYLGEGLEVLTNWIEKTVRTERYRYPIYSSDYGVTLEELTAANLPEGVVVNLLKQQISEALLQNPAITSVGGFKFQRDGSCMNISFEVATSVKETVKMEVGVDV